MKKIVAGFMLIAVFNTALGVSSAAQELLDEGKYQVEIGNYESGRQSLARYLREAQSPEGYLYMARAQKNLKDFTGAHTTIKKGEKQYPESSELTYERVLILDALVENETASQWRKGRYREEYYQVYERYLQMTNYSESERVFDLGNKYFIDDLYEKSNKVFLMDRNGDIKNLFGAATTSRFLGDYRRSIGLYTRVLEADPNFYEAYLGRGNAYQLAGDLNKGIGDMEKYLQYKKDPDVYLAIANMYMSLERYSSAKSVLERASGEFPSSQEIRSMLVEVYSKLKR